MGLALEWLGVDGCRAVAEELLTVMTRKSTPGRIWAHCPFHQEGTPGDSFHYDPGTDTAYCHSCGNSIAGGAAVDLIGIYNVLTGRDTGDGAGIREFRDKYAPGRGGGWKPGQVKAKPAKRPQWEPRRVGEPVVAWRERAGAWVDKCAARLLASPELLERCAAWGLEPDGIKACRIGWNEMDKYPPRPSWGLPPAVNEHTGKPRTVWLPKGLVLPMYRRGGLMAVKVRREDLVDGPESLSDISYWEVRGSEAGAMFVYGRPGPVAVVVETERDAAMLWWACRGLGVTAVGTGGASKRPDAWAHAILSRAEVVLVAMDADQAGATAWPWWAAQYATAVRLLPPEGLGKDAGDLAGKVDMAAWVRAGLPGHALRRLDAARKRASRQPVARVDRRAARMFAGLVERMAGLEPDRAQALERVCTGLASCPVFVVADRGWLRVDASSPSWSRDHWDELKALDKDLAEVAEEFAAWWPWAVRGEAA